MKTLFATLMVFSICSSGLHAQGLDFGVKAGVNIANQKLSSDNYELDTKAKVLFHGGVFVTWMFTEKLGLQPEVLLSMQGSKYDYDGYDAGLITNYIIVPVLVRYNINDMFSVHAGPQFGFLLSAEEEDDGDKEDVKDDFKGTDIGAAFGLEVDLPANFGVGARYILGLSNVLADDASFGDAELKNGVIQIYVKFRIVRGTDDD
jgi:Outer membrane protein beta-barrel domain